MAPHSNDVVIVELQKIALKHGGILRAEEVVEEAENRNHPLHKHFLWDDTEAARRFRAQQARELISASVRWVKLNGDRRAVRVFVSLSPDRHRGGGYRDSVAVFSNKNMRDQMLLDALEDLRRWEARYSGLKELSEIYAASKKIRGRFVDILKAA